MPLVNAGPPGSTVDTEVAAPSVPAPRAPAEAVLEAPGGPPAGGALNAIGQARVRESAARNTSAADLFVAFRFAEALPLFEQALASCRSTLGSEHPDTLTVAGNLAVTHVAAGHRRKGLKLISANLAARVRVLGDLHPATLTARNALAVAHRINGDADTAVRLAKQVVLQRSRALGPTHVDTLTSRLGLALALAAAGDLTSAHRLLTSTIQDAEVRWGPDHGHTVTIVECARAVGLLRREV